MQKRKGFAPVNDTRLAYEVNGAGTALVLIHGFTLDSRMWDDQFDAFARHYQVIRYDMRGFGQSDLPRASASYAHADDLKALLRYLGVGQAHVLGLSMGAEVAINFALAYPRAVRTLIAADASLGGYSWSPEFVASLGPRNDAARAVGVQAAKEAWLAHALFAPALEQPTVADRLRRMVAAYSGWHLVSADPGRGLDPPAAQQLDKIAVPALIVVGERDLPDFLAISTLLERRIPQRHKIVMRGVGHMSNMEDPAHFNDVVLSYLAPR
jgi:pimeloyl-ACP methyl ester carboxylesterase